MLWHKVAFKKKNLSFKIQGFSVLLILMLKVIEYVVLKNQMNIIWHSINKNSY